LAQVSSSSLRLVPALQISMSRVFLVFFAFLSIYTHQGCGGSPAPTELAEATTAAPTTAATTKAAVAGSSVTTPAPPAETTAEPDDHDHDHDHDDTMVDMDMGYGYGFGM